MQSNGLFKSNAGSGVAKPDELSSWCLAKLAEVLPEGTYRWVDGEPGPAMFGWQTAQYRFTRYRDDEGATGPRILLAKDVKAIDLALSALYRARIVNETGGVGEH